MKLSSEIFGEVIYGPTREEGIAQGWLVDVSEAAKEAGIVMPVAITAAMQSDINAIPAGFEWQDPIGRLWDVLWMFRCAAVGILPREGDDQCMVYEIIMHHATPGGEVHEMYQVKAMCHPGDNFEPVITLMRPDED
jgi:hypothetical protein